MDLTTSIAILGVVATCILGLVSILLTKRLRKYPNQITYYQESYVELYNAIVRNIEDLKLMYKGQAVGENTVLLKGYIVNTGSRDISPSMVEQPLAIKLPENYKWLYMKVIPEKSRIKADIVEVDDSTRELKMGMMRTGEYVNFEALIEEPQRGNVKDYLSFTHRIANTQSVARTEIPSLKSSKQSLASLRIFLVIFLFLLLVDSLFIIARSKVRSYDRWLNERLSEMRLASGDTLGVKTQIDENDSLVVKTTGIESFEQYYIREMLSKRSLESSNKSIVTINLETTGWIILFTTPVVLIALADSWRRYNRGQRIRRILLLGSKQKDI
jgi:hypothetical protein